jgi:hypothetical protein
MGNPISAQVTIGTIGELLVQLRLLQYGVQAAPPIKDSGNDLIAVKGDAFRSIQIKTCTEGKFSFRGLPVRYHILALVDLRGEDENIYLDHSRVYLIPRSLVPKVAKQRETLPAFAINAGHVDALFQTPTPIALNLFGETQGLRATNGS